MRLLWPLLLLFTGSAAMSVMESYEKHLNDLTSPVISKPSPRGPIRVKRYKCVEEYVDLPVSSTSESLSIFSHQLPPLSQTTQSSDEGLQRVEADHGVPRDDEMFSPDSAPSAARPSSRPMAAAARTRDAFSNARSAESDQPSPTPYSPQFMPPSFAISNSPFIQLPPPNTIASSRPLSQIRVPASTGRAAAIAPPPRPVQLMEPSQLHSGTVNGDRELPEIDFSMDEAPRSQPMPPSAPPIFSQSPPAATAASNGRLQQPPLFSISPTPLPPLPDFGAAPTFTISRNAESGEEQTSPDLLTHPRQSDIEDISVVPLNPTNPARGPKAIMRNGGRKHLPLNSNESEEAESPHEYRSYSAKNFRPFSRNSTRPNFKSAQPAEKLWAFSSWKAEEV